nr:MULTISPECIES: RusA family crossover junction endodeoxyribonuclease [Staphylococcus]
MISRSDNVQIEINFNETYEAPIGSPRPRFRNTGRYVQTYMPTSYTKHKDFIREQMPKALLDGKLKVTLSFYFKAPKSWSNRKKLLAIGQYKRTKPDIDNLIKTVLDAANDHLWKDDNQIVEIHSFKQYAEEPKIILEVEEV